MNDQDRWYNTEDRAEYNRIACEESAETWEDQFVDDSSAHIEHQRFVAGITDEDMSDDLPF